MPMVRPKMTKEEIVIELTPHVHGYLDLAAITPALSQLSSHGDTVCQDVLDLCWPDLQALDPGERKTWLHRLYVHLSDNLFPDEVTGHLAWPLRLDEAIYITVLDLVLSWQEETFDPLLDLLCVPADALSSSRVSEQYRLFQTAVKESHLIALMRIGKEIMPFDPASHTIGVHNVALHTAIMAVKAGIPVDLPLVSGAALGHDVGKFGCRGEDAARIPYLHYYYTWQWFSQLGLEDIFQPIILLGIWNLKIFPSNHYFLSMQIFGSAAPKEMTERNIWRSIVWTKPMKWFFLSCIT